MSFAPQLGQQITGGYPQQQNMQIERNRFDEIGLSSQIGSGGYTAGIAGITGLSSANNPTSLLGGNMNLNNNYTAGGVNNIGSSNLLQSTSSIGYTGNTNNVDYIANSYLPNNNQPTGGLVGGVSYSQKSYTSNYGDYGNISSNVQTNNITSNNNAYTNQVYGKTSYEQLTPLSQTSQQQPPQTFSASNINTSNPIGGQTTSNNPYQIGVQSINLTSNNTAQINLVNQPSSQSQQSVNYEKELKEKQERERLVQQIRQSQQLKQIQQDQKEEHDVAKAQYLMMEEMKRQLAEKNKIKQQQEQEQQEVTQSQLLQFEELKRQQQLERENSVNKNNNKKEQEQSQIQQRKAQQLQQQQQQQQQLILQQQAEQEEKKKRSTKQTAQQQQQQQQQQQLLLQQQQQEQLQQQLEQENRQREQEEILQRQLQQQQNEQEEYYQQQLEMQQKQIMEQQHLLEQMKQVMHQQNQQQNKQSAREQPPSSVKRSHNHKISSGQKQKTNNNFDSQPQSAQPVDPNLERRLEIIETSLNRVCNQHDALMPLLQLLETVPSLQRSEQQVKNLTKKYSDVEKRLKEIETSEKKDSQYQHIFSNIDRNFKNTTTQISQLKKDITQLETNIHAIQSIPEAKLKEDTLHLYRQVDAKLDRNMRDVKSLLAEFKNQVQLTVKRDQIGHNNNSHSSVERVIKSPKVRIESQQINDIDEEAEHQIYNNNQSNLRVYNDLNNRIDEQLDRFNTQQITHERYLSTTTQSTSNKSQIEIDIANIYREIGMLRSEMELLINKARSEFIQEQLSNISNPTETEKELFIAGLEQNMFLQEIESFDQLNQDRIQNELQLLEDKLQILDTDLYQMHESNTANNYINSNNNHENRQNPSNSQHFLMEQYQENDNNNNNNNESNLTNIDVVGYELKFIGDRLFNYKQQIHGTKKKYLCDCRRLEDRLSTLEYLSNKAEQEGTDNQVIQSICQIDKFKHRVDSINNSIGNHVASLLQKLQHVDSAFAKTRSIFKTTKETSQLNHHS